MSHAATEDIPDFKFYFLKYYVDDGNMASESLPAGARLIDGKVKIIEEFIESDLLLPKDIRTADIILQIANSISESTKLTVDCPSLNINNGNFMPILDVQVKVGQQPN